MNKRVTPPPCKQALKPIAFLPFSLPLPSSLRKLPNIREFKQQRRRRLRKRHLKSEFALLQTLSILFQLVQFVKCWHFFLELNSKRLYRSSGKEKESRCLVFTSSTKREIRHFYDVVVQRRQRNVQKSVMHVQSCCFANPNPLLFCRSRWRRRRCCLSSLLHQRVHHPYVTRGIKKENLLKTTDSHDCSITKRFYLGMGWGAEFVWALLVLELVCDVFIKKAYLRKISFTPSSSNEHIPPDTKTNALSIPGIISCIELPSTYITSLFSRSCITPFVRCVWQQIRRKISGQSGRK